MAEAAEAGEGAEAFGAEVAPDELGGQGFREAEEVESKAFSAEAEPEVAEGENTLRSQEEQQQFSREAAESKIGSGARTLTADEEALYSRVSRPKGFKEQV